MAMNVAQRLWTLAAEDGHAPASAAGMHDARDWQERDEGRNSNELAAQRAAAAVGAAPLGHGEAGAAATSIHFAFGATVGALYGALAGRSIRSSVAGGVGLGVGLWAAADEVAMPLLGLSRPTTERPAEKHLQSLAAHLVYGLVTEAVRSTVRPSRRHNGRGSAIEGADSAGPAVTADIGSDTRRRLGGPRGIRVQHSVTIEYPAADVYRCWRDLENLPRFMEHLESVTRAEHEAWRFVARGPGGTRVEWLARVINDIPGEVIAWQSLEGSTISTAGSVRFDERPHGTQVTVTMQYDAPGGKLGAAIARLMGEEPRVQVREDLRRFKQLLETGEVPTVEGQPSGRARRRGRKGA
jgi:uncharacterized membrane protein